MEMSYMQEKISRRDMLAASASGSVLAAAAPAMSASFGNPDGPPEGAVNAQGNPSRFTDPGPNNPVITTQFPGAFSPSATNVGDLPMFWASFNNAPRRTPAKMLRSGCTCHSWRSSRSSPVSR
jgi:oxalate decarboxylase